MSIDKLPDGWTRVKFGDVVRNSNENSRDLEADGIDRVIGLDHLDPGSLRLARWDNLAELPDGTTFTRKFKPGQVLFGKRRAYQRKVAVPDFEGVCSGDILVFEPADKRMLAEFLPYVVQSDGFFDHALGTSAGSLSPRTKWAELAKYEFALPPLDEQQRIVGLLRTTGESIVRYEQGINAANSLISAIVRAARERKNTSELTLGELFCVVGGATPSTANKENWDGGILWATPSDLTTCNTGELAATRRQISVQGLESCSASLVPAGSILLSTRATLGYPVLVREEMSFNQGVTGLIPSDLVNAKFFAFLLMQMEPEISRLASGSTFPEVSRSRLKKLKVRIPTRTVQDQAVNMIEHVQALVKHLRADEDLARMFRRTTLNALIGEPNVH
jgi:type I restriction enzyme S subunit